MKDKLLFADITTGRVWHAERADVLRADDGDAATLVPLHEVNAGLRGPGKTFRIRGGRGETPPGTAVIAGRGRVTRFAEDGHGELYVLSKTDGMIRRVVGFSRENCGRALAWAVPWRLWPASGRACPRR